MPANSTDADSDAVTDPGTDTAPVSTRRRRRRESAPVDWRLGGESVAGWNTTLLAVALLCVGAAVLVGGLLTQLVSAPWTSTAATVVLWIGLLAPIVLASPRSRPTGLLAIAPTDILFGVFFGVLLRLLQGSFDIWLGGSGAFPSYPLIGGDLPSGWWFTDAVAPVVIAPVLEEFFFHAVVLVAVYSLLRSSFGYVVAGIVALLVSGGVFVLLHAITLAPTADQVLALTSLTLVCGTLVLLTGRIWGAVLVHVVYNLTFVGLALVGTYLG